MTSTAEQSDGTAGELPEIPLFRCQEAFPTATLEAFEDRAHALIDCATVGIPKGALQLADQVSRRWLLKSGNAHLPEIDAIAEKLGRPGAYYLSVNYEWGCTVAVRQTEGVPELVRVLDWRTQGLGRYVMAADVACELGRFVSLTWPGYTGVLQAMATGRFAAAINQAPMPNRGGGLLPLDWLVNKVDVWRSRARTPAHLLRDVFERSPDYGDAKRRLTETPLASPTIFSLVGCHAGQTCVIERTEDDAHVHDGVRATANAWQAPAWTGRCRGDDNAVRVRQLVALPSAEISDFSWLEPPVLNANTRLAAIFIPATGEAHAQGFAGKVAATKVLSLTLSREYEFGAARQSGAQQRTYEMP